MAASDSRSIARRFFDEIINTGDWSNAEDIVSSDIIMNHPSSPQPVRGREAVSQAIGAFRAAFPDLVVTVDETIAEGDKVAIRWTASGTHTSDLFGVPPTGKQVRVGGISIMRIADGKIVEDTIQEDTLGMFQQLGFTPQPASPSG